MLNFHEGEWWHKPQVDPKIFSSVSIYRIFRHFIFQTTYLRVFFFIYNIFWLCIHEDLSSILIQKENMHPAHSHCCSEFRNQHCICIYDRYCLLPKIHQDSIYFILIYHLVLRSQKCFEVEKGISIPFIFWEVQLWHGSKVWQNRFNGLSV